jgi:hypothetical protein
MSLVRGGAVKAQDYDLPGHNLRWPKDGCKAGRYSNFLRPSAVYVIHRRPAEMRTTEEAIGRTKKGLRPRGITAMFDHQDHNSKSAITM